MAVKVECDQVFGSVFAELAAKANGVKVLGGSAMLIANHHVRVPPHIRRYAADLAGIFAAGILL
jgi:hypothetical protein